MMSPIFLKQKVLSFAVLVLQFIFVYISLEAGAACSVETVLGPMSKLYEPWATKSVAQSHFWQLRELYRHS